MLGPETPCEAWIGPEDLCCDLTGLIITPADPDTDPPTPAVYDPIVARSILAAQEYLYDSTCRRWPGVCTATVRPCPPCNCGVGFLDPWWWTGLSVGLPYLPGRQGGCECHWRHIELRAPFPILAILAFEVAGVDHLADVRLDSNRQMTLEDGSDLPWFPWQNLNAPDGDPGTWSVSYSFGAPPLELAKIANGDLACELIEACQGNECALPDGTVSVTKGGVTINLRGPDEGFTNVMTADLLTNRYGCPETPTARLIDPAERLPVYRGPYVP